MPVIVAKAARKPAYVDAPVPEPALRREHAMVSTHEPRFARAWLRTVRGLLTPDVKRELLAGIRGFQAGTLTVDEAVAAVPWYNPADPMAEKLWNMLGGSLRTALSDTIEDAGEGEMRHLGIPLKFVVQKIDAQRQIRVPINPFSIAYVRTRSARLVAGISEEQRALLRAIIVEMFEEGARPESVLDMIADVVGLTNREWGAVLNRDKALAATGMPDAKRRKAVQRYSDQLRIKRARRIARTETLDAYTQGLEDSWQLAREEGFIEPTAMKEWLEVTASPRTCKICRGLARQRVPVNEPFVSDVIGEVSRPPAHPHCRCTMLLVIPEDPAEIAFANHDVQAARDRLAGG